MRKLPVIILFLLNISLLMAQPTVKSQNVYSLDQCINIALRNNYEIKVAQAQVSAAGSDITSAFGDFLPSLDFNAGYSRRLNPEGNSSVNIGGQIIPIPASSPNSYNMSASASYLLFNGFSREANYSKTRDDYESTYNSLLYTENKVKMDIIRQYIDIIKKGQLVKVRQENLDLGRKELEKTKAQYDAGLISIAMVYSQEADLGSREYELVLAENDFNLSKAVLLTTMGMYPDIRSEFLESSLPTELPADDIKSFKAKTGNVDMAVQTALEKRLDYTSIKYGIEAAKSNITISEGGYYPSISLGGGWSWANSELKGFGDLGRTYLGLNFSLPIFENFKTNNRIQYAKLALLQSEVRRSQLEQSISSEIQTSFLNLEASEKSLEITERALKSAKLNFEASGERLKVGQESITDHLMANKLLVESQINRINAIYSYFLSQKQLLFSIGNL